ncbi:hypothetical protein CBG52_11630 [Fusobacterium polymorphum]|uniref:Uncharacterized protein n=1 Tax=Fusobacterium nucleatum subsp. polymorphum TaxID=76857 RepID=A0A2C6BKN8_FUSNP|nr:hypothetical protein CBG52_11630 [Fusobacterium polymorphum]
MTLNYKNCFLVSFFLLGLNYLICNSLILRFLRDFFMKIKFYLLIISNISSTVFSPKYIC